MILRKIIKIIATRCQILRLKLCTKFDSAAVIDRLLSCTALPRPPAGFKGPLRGREGKGMGSEEKREGEKG